MREILEDLVSGRDLSYETARSLLEMLTDPEVDPVASGAILAALRAKGETPAEVRGFAMGLRQQATSPPFDTPEGAVDIVGTGGDGSGSLNLSTGSALLAAACGLPVIKHGNRSISSRCGSADVLEALGLTIPLGDREVERSLDLAGFTFVFAPRYHPAMKAVAPVRQALAIRTIFNMVGPLANPAGPPYHVIGGFSLDAARLLASAAAGMPMRRTFVVHGAPGWDEVTPVGPYHLIDVVDGVVTEHVEDPLDLGIARCRPEDLLGSDAGFNAARLLSVFEGENGPVRDALLLGASLALRVTGTIDDPLDALVLAGEAIDDGRARRVLKSLVEVSSLGVVPNV